MANDCIEKCKSVPLDPITPVPTPGNQVDWNAPNDIKNKPFDVIGDGLSVDTDPVTGVKTLVADDTFEGSTAYWYTTSPEFQSDFLEKDTFHTVEVTPINNPAMKASRTYPASLTDPEGVWSTSGSVGFVEYGVGKQANIFEALMAFQFDGLQPGKTAQVFWGVGTPSAESVSGGSVSCEASTSGPSGVFFRKISFTSIIDDVDGVVAMPLSLNSDYDFKYRFEHIKRVVPAM